MNGSVLKLFFPPLLLCAFIAQASEQSFCDHFLSGRGNYSADDRATEKVCLAEFETFDGSFLVLEGGFMPVPREFYYERPHDSHMIRLGSGEMIRGISDWSYGIMVVGNQSHSRRQYAREIREVKHSTLEIFSSACGIPVVAWSFELAATQNDFSFTYSEAKVGESMLLIGGKSTHLLLAMLDAYRRLNCNG